MLRLTWFGNVIQDTRYGLRTLAKNPLLVLVATLSLGFGAGANTTVFNLVRSVVMRGITAKEPERLVKIAAGNSNMVSYLNYRDLQESKVFEDLIAHSNNLYSRVNWRTGDEIKSLYSQIVSNNFFNVLGVSAAMGRTFTTDEARPETNPNLVVLSSQFWTRSLGADPKIIGKVLTLNGQPFIVIGVLPKNYCSVEGVGLNPDIYVPLSNQIFSGLNDRSHAALELIGRLPANTTPFQARVALTSIAQRLETAYPESNKDFGKSIEFRTLSGLDRLRRMNEDSIGLPVLEISGAILAIVALVLLIACINIANLLLARGVNRRQEIAIRIAMGANRSRVIHQLLIETLLLSLVASGLGLLLNYWLNRLISNLDLPLPLPIKLELETDWAVVFYTFLLVVFMTVLCGLIPALRSTKVSLAPALKKEPTHFIYRRLTLNNFLLVAQVSISVVLMVGAALFTRSLQRLNSIDPGFDVRHTINANVELVSNRYSYKEQMALVEEMLNRLNATPGIVAASCASFPPLSMNDWGMRVYLEKASEAEQFRANIHMVSSGYFNTMGVPFIDGRDFDRSYSKGSPQVVIINQAFAQRYFNGESPIGKRLIAGKSALEIIGVVRDSKYRSLGENQTPLIYQSYQQVGGPIDGNYFSVLARADGPADPMVRVVKNALGDLDPSAAIEVNTMAQAIEPIIFPSRIGALLLGGIATVGLSLAMVGLYGTMAYMIDQRTYEIGVRMALGATRSRILLMIIRDGAALISIGIFIGVAVSLATTRLLNSLLVNGISSTDTFSFSAVVLLYGIIGVCTSLLVARKATRIDPVVTFRSQ